MSITRIVLTGGPCAGKSTGIAIIEQRLRGLGYYVVVLDEMATNVIKSGLTPVDLGIDFQYLLVQLQKNRDKAYNDILKNLGDKVVILYDRGIMDGQAYCSRSEFDSILERSGLLRNQMQDYYDGIFHLVTAADGAEKFYTTENNSARTETPEEAREKDKLTMGCWVGHPHLRIINNKGVDFNQKMTNLMKGITDLLGEPTPFEKERKFLIQMPDLDALSKKYKISRSNIIQTYLLSDNKSIERRVRQRGLPGDYVYYYTEKEDVSEATRIEREKKITSKEYITLLGEADTSLHQISKTRYCIVYKDKYFELDIYPFWNDKAILEIEVSDINDAFDMIPELKVIKEVTNDKRYKNKSLAKNSGNID